VLCFLCGTDRILKCYLDGPAQQTADLAFRSVSAVQGTVGTRTGDTRPVRKQLSDCAAKGAALFSCLHGTGSHASFLCCAGSAWLTAMYGRNLSVSLRGAARAHTRPQLQQRRFELAPSHTKATRGQAAGRTGTRLIIPLFHNDVSTTAVRSSPLLCWSGKETVVACVMTRLCPNVCCLKPFDWQQLQRGTSGSV
jgi:hypothetical protein